MTSSFERASTTVVTGPNSGGRSNFLGGLAGRIAAPAGTARLGDLLIGTLSAESMGQTLTLVEADDWLADATVAQNLRRGS
jgi:ATP-binding cassette subfamily C protein CydC